MSTDDSKKPKATIKLLVESGAADGFVTAKDDDRNHTGSMISGGTEGVAKDDAENKAKSIKIHDRLVAANMLVSGSQLGQDFQDQYRRIKRPLLSNAFGKTASLVDNGNLILVTSSVPGEGKTFTSVNLALSIAQEKDKTVLLVDCDVARQGVSRMLGIEKLEGLVDVLQGYVKSIGDVLLQPDILNLRLLSAGKQEEYVTELLASNRMAELVNELISRYDDRVIIFDGPPLLATPETQILAGLVGQVVFVVETGKTSQSLVEDALRLIPEEKATGVVMNKNEGLIGKIGYSYGYTGYYGQEGSEK
jgi:exopolysaccharide/PEP-CTERM locus tyrosine autokinase